MSNALYDLLFDGVAEGRDTTEVKAAFAALFSLSEEKVERIFSANQTVLKSKVDAATAEKYISRLATIGVAVTKRLVDVAPPALELSLEPVVANTNPEMAFSRNSQDSVADVIFAGKEESVEDDTVRKLAFEFNGKGFEYFKIWIVNILLSIVTLGIYSAWAKVRNKQYFYGNTQLDNASFEYTAEPLKILKGRLIAVAFLVVYSVSAKLSPLFGVIMALLLLVFLPWIIVNSLKFNARHTSYRNLSFRFVGTIGGALKAFLLWPLAGVLSLGLLFPFVWKKQTQYITSNHLYGTAPFSFDVEVKEYYKMLLLLIGGCVAFGVGMMLIFGSAITALVAGGVENLGSSMMLTLLGMIPATIAYILFYFAVTAFVVVTMANIHMNNTQLQQHKFESNWSIVSYTLLLLTNTLGIIFTLGLFIPVAKVRTAAYKAAHTRFVARGNLSNFIAAEIEQSNSMAEGVHDIFDIDISL